MKSLFAILMLLVVAPWVPAQDWAWAKKDKDGLVVVDASKVKGNVVTSGSSTVFPIAQWVAEQFKGEGYQGQLSIDNIGTGAGMKRFGAGEIDFANASREITFGEKKAAEARGRGKVLEFKLALDALVLLVNAKNTFVKDLGADQVRALFSTAEFWSDVDPSWPREKINRYIPETSHGTFDYFQEQFWNDKGAVLKTSPATQRFQDYNQLITAVERDTNAIGFIGFAYFKESDFTRAVNYEGIAANRKTVEDKTYGLSRYLYTYTTVGILTAKPQAAAYLGFFLGITNKVSGRLGYFPLPEAELLTQKRLLATTLSGKL